MMLRNLAHITHLIYFFTGTAAGTSNGHEPTAAYQGSSWGATIHSSISEAKTQVQQHKTRLGFIAYHYASLSIITIHYSSLLIITHCYSYLRNIAHIEEEMSNA